MSMFTIFNFDSVKAIASSMLLITSMNAHAIAFGEPDNNRHPNIASLRYIDALTYDAYLSCTGSLIHKDKDKYVILTAAHCALADLEGWNAQPAGKGSVGVSFDERNLPNDSDPTDGTVDGLNHVSGGVAFTHPNYRYPGTQGYNDSLDIAIVVFPVNAVNSRNQTIKSRWGNITPFSLPQLNQANAIVQSLKPNETLLFTAVGYGIQSDKSPQAAGEGNKEKIDVNGSFPNRNLALVVFRQLNGDMIDVDVNLAQGDATGYLCSGDSGSPVLYKNALGTEIPLGVLTAGNCRSIGAYSRIDLAPALEFIKCGFVNGNAAKVEACIRSKFK